MKGRLLLVAIACGSLWLMNVPGSSARAPSPVGVIEGEYYVHLTGKISARHGAIKFNVWNHGEDDHQLYIGRNSKQYGLIARLQPDEHRSITVNLPPGTYNLACRLPGHLGLGMVTHFKVT